MTLAEVLVDVWRQVMAEGHETVEVAGERVRTGRTRARGLRTVAFRAEGVSLEGIEQNPEKDSRWGKLAREGHRIMQFSTGHRYVANVCDGVLTRYPAWRGQKLPE
jgi:hypothetical protein